MLRFEELPKVNSEQWLALENLPEEEWRDVPQFKGLLMVSNYARVMKLPRFRSPNKMILKNCMVGKYYAVCLTVNWKQIKLYIHRLVASAFIENKENKPCIDHINANRLDNTKFNLRWVTYKENINNPVTKRRRSKRIAKEDKEGNILRIYESVQEAAEDNHISEPSISNAANRRVIKDKNNRVYTYRTAGGYIWNYI